MVKKVKVHLIYQTYSFEKEEVKKDEVNWLINYHDYLEMNQMTKYDLTFEEFIRESVELFWDDKMMNLNKEVNNNIICIAKLGLWNGNPTGYKMMGRNLNEGAPS